MISCFSGIKRCRNEVFDISCIPVYNVCAEKDEKIQAASEQEMEETIHYALERGINYFDMASAEAKPFVAYGRALKGNRDKAYFQIHFGANYETVTYGWTTNMDTIKRSVDWQLLDAKTSPFGQALTEYQCLQYALDKTGVLTVLPGIRGKADLDRILGFLEAAPDEKDYSVIGSFTPREASPCGSGFQNGDDRILFCEQLRL